MAEETAVVAPVSEAPAATPAPETAAAETKVSEGTLLGKSGTADEIAKLAKESEKVPENETPEQKTAREAAAQAAASSVPEKYELKAPEGMTIDQGMLDGLTPVFKKHGLTQAAVQELADAYAPVIKAQTEAQQKAAIDHFQGIVNGWKEETTKMLGATPDKEMAFAAKFLNKFGTPQLREMFDETGVGNHPELVKALIKAGKLLGEDSFVDGSQKTTGGKGDFVSIYDHPTSKATLK